MSLKLDKANKFCDWSGGVCAGLAKHWSVDVGLIRLLFVAGLFAWGAGPLLYLILWVTLNEKS